MKTLQCISRDELKDYVSGWTDADQSEAIETHLTQCAACEQTVEELQSDPESLVEFIRSSRESELPPNAVADPAVAYALSQVKNNPVEKSSSASSQPAPWQPPAGDFGPYELLRPLGQGGMASVYLARHRQLGKQVAIKLLPSRPFRNDHYAARFQREIRTAGQLNHPAIVSATDAGEHAGTHYLVMEYIEGLDLSRVARLNGPLRIEDACAIMRTVAIGLSHAHAEGIVHRDIKPSNLMLSQSGDVKVLDFGLAQVSLWDEVSAELTTVGQLMGTLDYMAPEQAERPDAVDYRADLYSIGATLFRLLCGRAPLAAAPDLSPLAKLRLLASHQPPRLDTLRSDAPEKLVAFVAQLLARDPADRPASAAHVAEQLSQFTGNADLNSLIKEAMNRDAAKSAEGSDSELAAARGLMTGDTNQTTAQLASAVGSNAGGNGGWKRWWVAAAMLPLFVFAGVLISLETQKGQLVIESESGDVEVKVLRDGKFYESLQIQPGANATRLYSGRYEVILGEGSDSVSLDRREIEVKRGGIVIARVTETLQTDIKHEPKTETTRILSSTSKLQINDQVVVICHNDLNLNARVVVAPDGTIKLPYIGIVSANGETIDSLQQKLGTLYKKFVREQSIEVYHGSGTYPSSINFAIDQKPSRFGNPAGNNAPLMPGDQLMVLNQFDSAMNLRVTVLADDVVRLPLIGTVTTKGETLTSLEEKLKKLYSPYYKEPFVELFRISDAGKQITAIPETRDGKAVIPESSEPNELLYDGKPLSAWLRIVEVERSSDELKKAIAAMAALRTDGAPSERISRALLSTLRDVQLPYEVAEPAFDLLRKCQKDWADFYRLLANELKTAKASWQLLILRHGLSVDSDSKFGPSFVADFEPMREWIVANVLNAERSTELTQLVERQLGSAGDYPNVPSDVKKLFVDMLAQSPAVGYEYWLGDRYIDRGSGGRMFSQPPAPESSTAIESKAIAALASAETPKKFVYQASLVLKEFNSKEYDRTGRPPTPSREVLAQAVAQQFERVMKEPDGITLLVALDSRYRSTRYNQLPQVLMAVRGEAPSYLTNVRLAYTVRPATVSDRLNFAIELLDFVRAFELADLLQPQLEQWAEVTSSDSAEFAARVANPFSNVKDNASPTMQLAWPSMDFNLTLTGRVFGEAPTQEQLVHYLAFEICLSMLKTKERREKLVGSAKVDFTSKWIRKLIGKIDEDGDGKLSLEEADRGLKLSSWVPKVESPTAESDKDGDKFLSEEELIERFASAPPVAVPQKTSSSETPLEFAARQIAKYDKDGNGGLTQDEWQLMIIRPDAADVNNDGIITVEEYSNFRMKQKK